MIEEVLSVKCQVLSRAGWAGSLPRPIASNLTLQTSGGTPAAEGLSYQTKPIPSRNAHRFTILLFHHSSPMMIVPNKANSPGGAGLSCTNKPNFRQSGESPGGETCETNPIRSSPEDLAGQALPYPWAKLRQTNPIPPGRLAGSLGAANVRNKPNQNHRQSRWYEEGP